jgi:hypothetical protein
VQEPEDHEEEWNAEENASAPEDAALALHASHLTSPTAEGTDAVVGIGLATDATYE